MFDLLDGIIGVTGGEESIKNLPGMNFDSNYEDKFVSKQLPSLI